MKAKPKLFLKALVCIVLIIISLGCTKNADPNVDNPQVKIPKADSIVTHGGNGRIEITWLVESDSNIHSYKVVWYSANYRGDTSNVIHKAYGKNLMSLTVNGIKEGKYIFEIFMYDKEGNPSPKSSTTGTVYGAEYQSSLVGRTYNNVKINNGNIILNWVPVEEGMVGVEVRYKDVHQDSIIHFVPVGKALDTIERTILNQYIKYRTLYLPDPTAIDTFYSDYVGVHFGNKYEYELHYDAASNTSYYLTRIHHVDAYGELIKLRLAHTIEREGETVMEFADRTSSTLAFNASTQIKYENDKERADMPSVVAIVDGDIINNAPRNNRYTLGIKDNNELIVFDPGTSAQSILNSGVMNAVTAFVPLIMDHNVVSEDILDYVGNLSMKHPRQIIAQFANLDILFLTTGGRGFGGDGMTAKEAVRILKNLNVKFAYNLDGGGSTSTIVKGKFINWMIDKNGTQQRKRPTFLYIK